MQRVTEDSLYRMANQSLAERASYVDQVQKREIKWLVKPVMKIPLIPPTPKIEDKGFV